MNGKKAKELRKETREIPFMIESILLSSCGFRTDRKGKRYQMRPLLGKQRVNHYKKAKKFLKSCGGDVKTAVREYIHHAECNEILGIYKFK